MAKTRAYDNEVYFVVCNQTGVISPVMEGLGKFHGSLSLRQARRDLRHRRRRYQGLY